ncbi:MAG: hypothetical protein IPL91_06495 [Hyphomicrobium sp.]|nr:hypothetical protein [Hyphomicrobium sp.]
MASSTIWPPLYRTCARLPARCADQREALILIGAEGFSYEEAALMCGCAVGTMKSRVNRARGRLCDMLGIEGAGDFGPEITTTSRATSAHG